MYRPIGMIAALAVAIGAMAQTDDTTSRAGHDRTLHIIATAEGRGETLPCG